MPANTVSCEIGRYRNLGELGRGDNAIVYRGQNIDTGQVVAVKTYRLGREWTKERVREEADLGAMLSHPNIITTHGCSVHAGQAYIFMECLHEASSLEKAMSGPEPVRAANAVAILRQAASALDHMHQKGIIYRDMKPSNILIHHHGTHAKIVDLGSAQIILTQTIPWYGALSYVVPEYLQGRAGDGRADQWSLAVIAYEVLTGKKPFRLCGEPPYPKALMPVLAFSIVNDAPTQPSVIAGIKRPQFRRFCSQGKEQPSAGTRYRLYTRF